MDSTWGECQEWNGRRYVLHRMEIKHLLHLVGKVSDCLPLDLSDALLATSTSGILFEAGKTVLSHCYKSIKLCMAWYRPQKQCEFTTPTNYILPLNVLPIYHFPDNISFKTCIFVSCFPERGWQYLTILDLITFSMAKAHVCEICIPFVLASLAMSIFNKCVD